MLKSGTTTGGCAERHYGASFRSERCMKRILDIAALSGPAAVVVTLIGWLISGMLPLPMGPSSSTDEVVAFFTDAPDRVMAGFVLSSIGVVLMVPMLALLSVHMLRMEGRAPILAFTQL